MFILYIFGGLLLLLILIIIIGFLFPEEPNKPNKPIGFIDWCGGKYGGPDCDYPDCECGRPIYKGDKERSRY